jgi:hypothetical protein
VNPLASYVFSFGIFYQVWANAKIIILAVCPPSIFSCVRHWLLHLRPAGAYPPSGRPPHRWGCPPATGHASASGSGRPSNRAPLVELVACRLATRVARRWFSVTTVGRNDDWRHKRRAGGGLPDVLMPATISPTCRRTLPNLLLLSTSTTPSRRCLPNLPLQVSSLSSFHNLEYMQLARFTPMSFVQNCW